MARTTTITTTAVRVRLSQCVKSADPRVREPDGEAFVQSDATIPDDSVETAEWCRERAESGKSFAMNNLAYLYEHGLCGVEKDDAQALSWYWKAVEAGEPAAMNNLAYAYANGLINLTKDDTQAAGLYRKPRTPATPHRCTTSPTSTRTGWADYPKIRFGH